MNDKIRHLRQEYAHSVLEESALETNPFLQFRKWFEEAIQSEIPEPHAMTLSTVSSEGRPSSRIVLLRNFDENGFSFFTNYLSKKSKDISHNSFAALNFFWQAIERQVRIEGRIERVSEKESDDYFASRPRESQIGAWASLQSKSIESRSELEEQVIFYTKKFENVAVPRPSHWGGFIIIPDYFEFWQGRPSRLHDRISFEMKQQTWDIKRLNP